MPEEILFGQYFEVCPPNYGHGHYSPKKWFKGCYAPNPRRQFCTTFHVQIWANQCAGIPPTGKPTYDGLADYRILPQRLIVVPGAALINSGGIGLTNTQAYIAVVDDASGKVVMWFIVKDWSFTTQYLSDTEYAVDWIALSLMEHNPFLMMRREPSGGMCYGNAYPNPYEGGTPYGQGGGGDFGPTVTGVSPSNGAIAGGTALTITGTGFTSPAVVTVGGVPATSVVVVSPTEITATTPAGSAGNTNVIVFDSGGVSPTGSGNSFTYNGPAPTAFQTVDNFDSSGGSATAVFSWGSPTTTGSTLVIGIWSTTATTITLPSGWTQISATVAASGRVLYILVAENAASQSTTTFGFSPTISYWGAGAEVLGAAAVSIDQSSSSIGSTNPASSGPVTPVDSPSELAVAIYGCDNGGFDNPSGAWTGFVESNAIVLATTTTSGSAVNFSVNNLYDPTANWAAATILFHS